LNDDLEVLLRSRIPIIAVESRDEAQVIKSLLRACSKQPGGVPAPGATAAARSVGSMKSRRLRRRGHGRRRHAPRAGRLSHLAGRENPRDRTVAAD